MKLQWRSKRVRVVVGMATALVMGTSLFAQDDTRRSLLIKELLASPQWKNFRQVLMENYLEQPNDAALQAHCLESIDESVSTIDEGVVEKCLRNVARGVEQPSEYFSAPEVAIKDAESKRRFVGIGLELKPRDGLVEIVSAIRGSPAEAASLLAGDLIFTVNGTVIRDMPLRRVIELMRGEAGTDLTLTVYRQGTAAPIQFVVTRAEIKVLSVRATMPSPRVAYLRISQLVEGTRGEIIANLQKLNAQSGLPLKGLVLDLRNNPGGLLDATVGVSSLFVPSGSVVLRVAGRRAESTQTYFASVAPLTTKQKPQIAEPEGWSLKGVPIVVLTNKGTAGGSEALTALLREQSRATVVGTHSAGYGLIEQIFRLESGAAVRVPVARMASPGEMVWHGKGIRPDISLPASTEGILKYGDLEWDSVLVAALKLF